MPRAPKPAPRTFHHLDVAASLEAQSQAVLNLIHAVSAVISLDGEKLSAPLLAALVKASAAAEAAMWPGGEM